MKPSHLILKSMAFAVAMSAACMAQAAPYAYAVIAFSNLTLSGLAPGSVTGSTVTTSSTANYGSAPGQALSAGGDLTSGSDTLQAFAGPGPFPGQNNYGQALTSTYGTRGDAQISGNLLTGLPGSTAQAVSEGNLLAAPGTTSAASTGGTTTGFSFNFSVTSPTTLTLSFQAREIANVITTAIGDGASAQVSSSFSITGIGNGFSDIFAPDQLQAALSLSNIGTASKDSGVINLTRTFVLGAGNYQFSFLTGTQERLSANVPEPTPLVLLGIGMLGFAASRLRKNGKTGA